MSISPVSNVNATHGNQNVQTPTPTSKKPATSEPAKDTVQLSQAALQHLQGGDKDHDGDSH